ncbi:hypothetical protein L6452_37323 [Arctium lappa]|uniref:Uncharacterized protein n=1 Tax=Arctium lappa TaxID=4217 RepID=A0ACB8Y6U6_ARCLA|nr:hypothetical protein L6452_37323 [Arctium lappa]
MERSRNRKGRNNNRGQHNGEESGEGEHIRGLSLHLADLDGSEGSGMGRGGLISSQIGEWDDINISLGRHLGEWDGGLNIRERIEDRAEEG